MERLRKECEEAYQEVVRQLDPLEGTEYAGIADEIKIGLHNRLQDIVSSVASMRDDECVKGDYKGVEFLKINGCDFGFTQKKTHPIGYCILVSHCM